MKIIANMIVKNEADRYLIPVLERLRDCVDEIVITDDGSTDNTFEIAKQYGRAMRMSDSVFESDESEIRSTSWRHVSHYAERGDWILSIDADEIIYGLDKNVRAFIQASQHISVVQVWFYHMWNLYDYRVDKAWKPDMQPRLFRYDSSGLIQRRQLACGQYPTYVKQMVRDGRSVDLGVNIKHMGYAKEEDRIIKSAKYLRIDGGKFHSLPHLESILDPDPTLVPWSDLNVF